MEGGYLTATNWSFGWWRNWGCRLSRPGADGKGRAWEWVGEGEGSLKRDRIPVQWSRAGCAQGQRSKWKYLLTPKARGRKKIHSPREQRCHGTWDLALLLVTVLLPLPCWGLVVWVLSTAGEASQTTRVGCGIAPLAAQHLSPGCPKGFPGIHPALGVCLSPVGLCDGSWQGPGGHGFTGCHGGDPCPTELSPFGWAGWMLPTCQSVARCIPPRHAAPWGHQGLPTATGLFPNPA